MCNFKSRFRIFVLSGKSRRELAVAGILFDREPFAGHAAGQGTGWKPMLRLNCSWNAFFRLARPGGYGLEAPCDG
jgi:hypothetical protein